MSNILVILSTHTRQLTSLFSISQLPINTDESSFKHFIDQLVGVRENSKFLAQQVRLKPKQDQLVMLRTKHNQRSSIYAKSNIAKQLNRRTNKVANKRKKHHIEEKEEETYH